MKIENLRTEQHGSSVRSVATLIWENCDRPAQDIYFETTEEFASDLSCNPHAFLIAGIIPAMRYGEARLAIDEEICPQLRKGLITNMNWLSHWYGGDRQPIPIEAPVQSQPTNLNKSERAGLFFSGGVDSLSALRNNRLHFPKEHPRSIKDGLLVYGLLKGEDEFNPAFEGVVRAVSKIANDADLTLIPVNTNIYTHLKDLDLNFHFWKYEYQGAALSSIAHAFSQRLTEVSIASTFDLANLDVWGSHPLLDSNFSSNSFQIHHENFVSSRLAKIELIAEWDTAIKNLVVCNKTQYQHDRLNCGKCDKCVRTMTALLALNLLHQTNTFSASDVSESLLVKAAKISDSYGASCYRELILPLSAQGRDDLVRGIQRAIARYEEKDLKGIIKRIDRSLLKGLIQKKVSTAS